MASRCRPRAALARELGVVARGRRGGLRTARCRGLPRARARARRPRVAGARRRAGDRPGGAGASAAPRFDFRPGAPDVSRCSRARRGLRCAARRRCATPPTPTSSYGDPRGVARAAHRARRTTSDGCAAWPPSPRRSSSPRGLTQGLALVCRALAARGVRRIARRGARRAPSRASRSRPPAWSGSPSPVDGGGLDVDALERTRRRRGARHPGAPVPDRRRARARAARRAARVGGRPRRARDRGRLRRRVPLRPRSRSAPLQGLDAGARRLRGLGQQDARARRCGSAGSSCRRRWSEADRAREARRRPRHARCSTQLALADFLERGELDRHLRRMRARLPGAPATRSSPRSRAHLPGLPPARRRRRAAPARRPAARRRRGRRGRGRPARGVGLDGLAPHTARPQAPGVILGYGRIAEPAIEPGVRALAAAVAAVTPS